MAEIISKWTLDLHYGPRAGLSQSDVYFLNAMTEIHPILGQSSKTFRLDFNIATGEAGVSNIVDGSHDLPFFAKDEGATLPRLTELYIITHVSPWCTMVKNPRGVSVADICTALWRDYTDNNITAGEFATLPRTMRERASRTAASRERETAAWAAGQFFTPTRAAISRLKRVDILCDHVWFERLERNDEFAKKKLGFSAPNIFVMHLSDY